MWLQSRTVQLLGGGVIERLLIGIISRVQLVVLGGHKPKPTLDLIRHIRRSRRSLLTAEEAFILHSLAGAQSRVPGAMAEVGVYQGASARILCEVKGDKELHLFDTFEGLPESHERDRRIHKKNQYACSLESVQGYLAQQPNVHYHKGLFPQSADELAETRFCFAHFDVDLYESTRNCLEYFYPRMVPGGVLLSHDYSLLSGVKDAFQEFLADKPEGLIELPTTQCMIIKLPAEGEALRAEAA